MLNVEKEEDEDERGIFLSNNKNSGIEQGSGVECVFGGGVVLNKSKMSVLEEANSAHGPRFLLTGAGITVANV